MINKISVINRSKEDLGFELPAFCSALNEYNKLIVKSWGPASQATCIPAEHFTKSQWAMLFVNLSDVEEALAYHEVSGAGTPLALVFVDTIKQANQRIDVSASHEFAEMVVDPDVNKLVHGPNHSIYAVEACDPCEEQDFEVQGFRMSDFVFPNYFQSFNTKRMDYMGLIREPFQLLSGGYQSLYKNGEWTEIFGSDAKAARFKRENRTGHRSEIRKNM